MSNQIKWNGKWYSFRWINDDVLQIFFQDKWISINPDDVESE